MAVDPARMKASARQSFLFVPPSHPRMLKPLEDQKLNEATSGTESLRVKETALIKKPERRFPLCFGAILSLRDRPPQGAACLVLRSEQGVPLDGGPLVLPCRTGPVQSAPASVLLNTWKDVFPSLCL